MRKTSVRLTAVVLLALVLLFSCMTAYAADTKTYDYAKEYDTTQGPVWFYQFNDGSGYQDIKFYKEDWMTWTAGDQCKGPDGKDTYCNVYNDSATDSLKLHPDMYNGKPTLAVATWKAPADGKVTIAAAELLQNSYGSDSDGVDAAIMHNSTELFKAYVGANLKVAQPEITVDVKAGDAIHFEAGIHEKSGNDELGWPLTVTFEAAAAGAATTTTAENPTTGDTSMLLYILLGGAAVVLIGFVVLRKKAVRS